MANTYLSKTFGSAGNRKTWTWSGWLKRSALGNQQAFFAVSSGSSTFHILYFDTDDQLTYNYNSSNIINTTRVFRDTSGWFHVVIAQDTTQATSSDRVKIWVNGVQETVFDSSSYPSLNADLGINNNVRHDISNQGAYYNNNSYFDGQMAHVHFTDGYAYQASDFGQTDTTTGIWKPKTSPSVSYGNNGFKLLFENSSNMGLDSSGNSNNFTVSGSMTQNLDTPSNVFATLNPLTNDGGGAKTYSFGNTKVAETANSWTSAHTGLAVSTGKYYYEAKVTYTSSNEAYIGAASQKAILDRVTSTHYLGQTVDSVGFYTGNGSYYKGASGVAYGSSPSSGDIVGCALDLDNNYIYFSINGTWQNSGDPTSGATGTGGISLPSGMTTGDFIFLSVSPNQSYLECNFGNGFFGTTAVSSAQNPDDGIGIFEYSVPSGYKSLCTKSINAEEYS